MRRGLQGLVRAALIAIAVLLGTWGALALWFRLPAPDSLRLAVAALYALLGVIAVLSLARRRPLLAVAPFVLATFATLAWWTTITPPAQANWAPDVARQTTGTVDGNILTLRDVRNFDWRTDDSFDQRWETRSYDLSKLRTLDVFLSYWAGPQMAHVIMSFGFEDGPPLAWSIEVRRRQGGEFSPVADLFKSNPLVILAADERDVVRVRSNVRGEDVRLYRLATRPDVARAVLMEYVDDANALAVRPAFYNSITTNCTTTVVRLMRAAGRQIPFDWRLIVNGYLPDYLYENGAVVTDLPLAQLTERGRINARATAADASPEFSTLIRAGVPSPRS
ncbi:Lnb N-terminal periplasmic domain-containing protein [Alsobacter sp. R-9]